MTSASMLQMSSYEIPALGKKRTNTIFHSYSNCTMSNIHMDRKSNELRKYSIYKLANQINSFQRKKNDVLYLALIRMNVAMLAHQICR